MESGHNWSGNERNVAFLNTRDGRFAGVSALTGFDSPADGRAMAMVDWDHDGDLDIWITQRTAPRLRFLRNDNHSAAKSLRIQLHTPQSNLHGIGARVELTDTSDHRQIRSLRAGEGYLAQSSQSLHFGLGTNDSAASIKVRWPDGQTNTYQSPANTPWIRLTQNDHQVIPVTAARNGMSIRPEEAPTLAAPEVNRIIPHSPLPLPPASFVDEKGDTRELKSTGRRRLIVLWATWCLPCLQELTQLNENQDALADQGLDIMLLNLDDIGKPSAGRLTTVQRMLRRQKWTLNGGLATTSVMEIADAAREAILGRQWTWSIPSSILLDETGRLLAFYEGSPSLETLLSDTKSLFRKGHDREHAVPYTGKWYVEPYPPDHLALATILKDKKKFKELAGYLKHANWTTSEEREKASYLIRDAGIEAASVDAVLAEHLLTESVRLMPTNSEHRYTQAMFYQATSRFAKAIQGYEEALKQDPNHLKAMAGLGWLLAVSPDAGLRNPGKAIQLATRASVQTNHQAPETLDILAAAFASNGQFTQASDLAEKALQLLPVANRNTSPIRQRLDLYRQQRAFHLGTSDDQ